MIDIITYCILGLIILLFVLIVIVPFGFMRKFSFNLLVSFLALVLAKLICIPFGIHIGLNPITILFTVLLGVPGFTSIVLLSVIL